MNKFTIIDVRTPEEFQEGHVNGSINIPLNDLQRRINELQSMRSPILLCCASGARSGMACGLLRQHGIDCENAGSWYDAERLIINA